MEPNAASPKPATPRNRKVMLAIVGAIALYGIVAGLAAPPLARKAIADKLGEALGRVVVLDDLSFNPYTLNGTAKGFRILEPDGRTVLASFERLDVDGSIASLYRLAPVADELSIGGLRVNLVRDGETHYNVSDILGRLATRQSGEPADGKKARFSLSNIRILDGRVDFDDRPKGARHGVTEINVAIPFVSNLPRHLKDYVQPSFAAKVNGTPLRISGKTLPFEDSLATQVALDLDAFEIQRYVGYSPTPLPVKVESGKLQARISVRFTQAAGKDPSVNIAGKLALHELRLATPEAGPLARFDRVEADVGSFDPIAGIASVSSLRIAGVAANQDQWLVPETEATGISIDLRKKTAHADSLASRDGTLGFKRAADGTLENPLRALAGGGGGPEAASTPWVATLGKLTLDGYNVSLADAAVKPAALHKVAITHLEAADLSSAKGASNTVAAHIATDKGGSIEVRSTVGLDPLTVAAQVDARRIDLVPFRAYAEHFKTVALKSGLVSAKGNVTLSGAGDAMRVAYRGSADVAKLATWDTTIREDLVNWNAVRMRGVAFEWARNAALRLGVDEIAVDGAYARVIVTPEGKINLTQLKFATADEPNAAPAEPPKPREVRIGRIVFADSRLNFSDHFIKPNYTADVGELHGSVRDLSSAPESRGVVDLQGSYDQTSPVTIAGTINPLAGDLFLDIAAKGKDIELPKLSAYSLRYAGYGITQGKLTLDVKYHVEDGKLQGRNNIHLDQLVFGDKVENPEATQLPVLFAVNLLKDSKGAINLELPITGSLQDPQFEIGGLITQVVVSLLKKAITSPFSLLTAAFGGAGADKAANGAPSGDDLAFVDFDAGGDEVGPQGQKKLDAVAKALLDRPAIRIEMAPRVDEEKDLQALKRAALARQVSEAKGGAVAPEEYPRYLKAVFERSGIPKPPAPKDGPPREMPVAEMEAALLERVEIGAADLGALAQRRSEHVRSYLVDQGKLPSERILVAATADASAGKASATRVDFTLR
jgi:uncharacterized protein involved in outer membrane biogenesis